MSRTSNSSMRKKTEGTTRRGRPRQVRLGFSSTANNISRSDIEKLKQTISEQQFEEQLKANSPLDAFEKAQQENDKNNELIKQINDLMQQNALLEKRAKTLEESNVILKQQIDEQNNSFLQKIQEKTEQAQKLVDEKIAYLEAKKNEEIQHIRLSVFEEVASSFLEPIILLQSIITSSPSDPVVANYLQGFTMLLNQFDEKLSDLGVDEINVNVGDTFNELYMEAFDVVETNDFPPNTVVKVVKKGFVINQNKVLKHTLVVVSK